MSTTAPDRDALEYLTPHMNRLPVSNSRVVQSVHITTAVPLETGATKGRIELPLAPPAPRRSTEWARPAEGVLITHRQGWYLEGTALGELLHSVTLAPGEVTQVAVTHHTQSVLQRSADISAIDERVTQDSAAGTTLDEEEKSSAAEQSSGWSVAKTRSTSSEMGVGGAASFFGFSGGSASQHTSASMVSHSQGVRDVAHSGNQRLHQRARESAGLNREHHAASVREVHEHEGVELQTRVVVNYNHMHALTMQYFEVLHVAALETRVIDAERLLFIPVQLLDLTEPTVARRFRMEISRTARDLGYPEIAARYEIMTQPLSKHSAAEPFDVDELGDKGETNSETIGAWKVNKESLLTRRLNVLRGEVKSTGDRLDAAVERHDAARSKWLTARDALRAERDGAGLAKRDVLQNEVRAARALMEAAADEAQGLRAELRARRDSVRALTHVQRDWRAGQAIDPDDLAQFMREHQLAFNQGIWMQLGPAFWAAVLQGRAHHDGKKKRPLADCITPEPVAVSGALVGFRWHHASPAAEKKFRDRYVGKAEPLRDAISLPTGGVFAEAVLAESNAAEKLDITRFWNWKDALPPIRPAGIEALSQPGWRPPSAPTQPGTPAARLALGPTRFIQPDSPLSEVTAALANAELFHDLSGTETAAKLAQSATELTRKGAGTAADIAASNFKRYLQFQQKLATEVAKAASSRSSASLDPTVAGAVVNARSAGKPSAPSGDDGDDEVKVEFIPGDES